MDLNPAPVLAWAGAGVEPSLSPSMVTDGDLAGDIESLAIEEIGVSSPPPRAAIRLDEEEGLSILGAATITGPEIVDVEGPGAAEPAFLPLSLSFAFDGLGFDARVAKKSSWFGAVLTKKNR